MANDLHTMFGQFARIPGARIGPLPDEQSEGSPFAAIVKTNIKDDFPQFAWDVGYTDFLSTYGGAIVWNGKSNLILDIPGPSYVSGNVSWDDISVAIDEGFFPLCFIKLPPWRRFDFSLNLSEARTRGIYVSNFDRDHNTVITWYCETFLDLLARIVGQEDYFSEVPR